MCKNKLDNPVDFGHMWCRIRIEDGDDSLWGDIGSAGLAVLGVRFFDEMPDAEGQLSHRVLVYFLAVALVDLR